jgi:deoxyribonuclease IV
VIGSGVKGKGSGGRGLRLGAHMSIAGGMPLAVERATSVGATALQVFVKSSSQWSARPFLAGESVAFRAAARGAGLLGHTVAHASYLVNLASPDDVLWRRSAASFREEMERCAALGIGALVVHPGSHVGSGATEGATRVVRALDALLGARPSNGVRAAAVPKGFKVLLEITAGQGSSLGSTFEEIAWILRRASCSRGLGVCFDTCHALAAGYEFRDARSYRETFAEFDRIVGIPRIRAFHLNDSKGGLGSRLDRHEHIGRGEVGLEAFRLILADRRFRGVPMVLETPKGEDLAEDRRNLAVLHAMVAR